MEKFNFVKNGVLRLPPGFRFSPTDEELVVLYLRGKAFSSPLPAAIIPVVDVGKADPWDLPGELEKERYFFSRRETKYLNGNRSNRATVSGYWKASGSDKKIFTSRGNQLVGMKKTLVFYKGKPPHGTRTDWIMHEYSLTGLEIPVTTTNASSQANSSTTQIKEQPENWVLCRIFFKKRSRKSEDGSTRGCQNCHKSLDTRKNRLSFYVLMAKNIIDLNMSPAAPSSSGSSEITEVSNLNELDGNEESSSCSSFMSIRRKTLPIKTFFRYPFY